MYIGVSAIDTCDPVSKNMLFKISQIYLICLLPKIVQKFTYIRLIHLIISINISESQKHAPHLNYVLCLIILCERNGTDGNYFNVY